MMGFWHIPWLQTSVKCSTRVCLKKPLGSFNWSTNYQGMLEDMTTLQLWLLISFQVQFKVLFLTFTVWLDSRVLQQYIPHPILIQWIQMSPENLFRNPPPPFSWGKGNGDILIGIHFLWAQVYFRIGLSVCSYSIGFPQAIKIVIWNKLWKINWLIIVLFLTNYLTDIDYGAVFVFRFFYWWCLIAFLLMYMNGRVQIFLTVVKCRHNKQITFETKFSFCVCFTKKKIMKQSGLKL